VVTEGINDRMLKVVTIAEGGYVPQPHQEGGGEDARHYPPVELMRRNVFAAGT